MQVKSRSGTNSILHHMQRTLSGKNKELIKILKKLEEIIEQGHNFLPHLSGNSTISSGNHTPNPGIVTTSSAKPLTIGRDEERDNIVSMLRQAPGGSSMCYSTIGIYGVAGSGKTTIAQHVCTFERTRDHFSPVMWIHVGPSFSVYKVYQEMLESASGQPSREFSNPDTLQMKLESQLRHKRFLLVLDDIWAEKDVNVQDKLDQLLSPLKVGGGGSKVLVTTRFKDAAISLGSQSPMQIPDLEEKDFFNLFMHYALDGANLELQELQTLRTIGGQIVKKLKRSPLAARVVGARLRKQLKAVFWERVADQDVLTETMGALWWSYRHLDEQVRRCFAYCSMFPQGYTFERDELVDLWLAEGFIKQTNSVEQLEDVGEKYFDELVSCSFLQNRKYSGGSETASKWFTIHDLLHELAVKVAGNDCFRVEGDEMKQFPPDVRHLFVRSDDPMKLTEEICKLKKLRTLFITTNFDGQGITIQALEVMLKKLKKLRVVQVYLEGDIVVIPGCICDLKHLRYLRIDHFLTVKVQFPRNLDILYHLHAIKLCGHSGALEFSNVKNMRHLINLRKITNNMFWSFPFDESVVVGLAGIGELKSLRELSHFSVRKKKGYELQQLKSLNHLGGSLRISGLENVESKESALEAKLIDKKDLTELSLAWSSLVQQSFYPDLQVEIIEGLCPPPQLTELDIYGYCGWKYPSWLTENQNDLIRSLQCLKLDKCFNLEALPDNIQHFLHLRELSLVYLPKLEKLPRLPDSLKTLDIQICKALVLTCVEDVEVIRSLFIESASQIEPSLSFTVHRPKEIDRFASEQPKRFEEILSDSFGSEGTLLARLIRGQMRDEDYSSQFLLPASLDSLIILYCTITDTVLQNCLRSSTSLTSLTIIGLPFFRAIPTEVMKCLAKLRHLSIRECVHFTRLQGLNHLSSLESLDVMGCAKLTALQEAEKVRTLMWLAVDDIPLVPNLLSREAISSLRILRIDGSEEPREEEILQQLTSLTSLDLFQCNWNSLPENLASLTCLQKLSLLDCKHIRSLPTLPASLRSFELGDCDQTFMKSCQKDGDPNWQKIAHVPNKRFS